MEFLKGRWRALDKMGVAETDDDERVFVFDAKEFHTQDAFLVSVLASFASLSNIVYRFSHRSGSAFLTALLLLFVPFGGFIYALAESLVVVLVRPAVRILYKSASFLRMGSDRYIWYRNYGDYQAGHLLL